MRAKKHEKMVNKPTSITGLGLILSACSHDIKTTILEHLPSYYRHQDPIVLIQIDQIPERAAKFNPKLLEYLFRLRHLDPKKNHQKLYRPIDDFFKLYFNTNNVSRRELMNLIGIVPYADCQRAIRNYKNAIKHILKYGLGSFFNEANMIMPAHIQEENAAIRALLNPKTSDSERYSVLAYMVKKFPDLQFTQIVAQDELGVKPLGLMPTMSASNKGDEKMAEKSVEPKPH